MLKPENHATRGMRERLSGPSIFTPPPRIPDAVVSWLAQQHPPKCYDPKKENLELHLLYAGRVQLIEELKGIVERQRMNDTALAALDGDDDDGGPVDGVEAAILDRLKED